MVDLQRLTDNHNECQSFLKLPHWLGTDLGTASNISGWFDIAGPYRQFPTIACRAGRMG